MQHYRRQVNVYPQRLGKTLLERKDHWNMLRGLAHGIAGRLALSGMTDDLFKAEERIHWPFPSERQALRFQERASRLLKGAGVSGAVKRIRRSR